MATNELGPVVRLEQRPGRKLLAEILAIGLVCLLFGWVATRPIVSRLPVGWLRSHVTEVLWSLVGLTVVLVVLAVSWYHGKGDRRWATATTSILVGLVAVLVGSGAHQVWALYRETKTINPAIVATPSPPEVVGGRYLALGDSYSAGEGLPAYEPGAGNGPGEDRCHRSPRAYGRLLSVEETIFLACAGSRTSDMLAEGLDAEQEGTPRYDEPRVTGPFPDPDAGLVTLTLGGNDAGFSHILVHCLERRSCLSRVFDDSWVGGPRTRLALEDWVDQRISFIRPRITQIYEWIREGVGDEARVVVLGYPDLMPPLEDSRHNCDTFFDGYRPGERRSLIRVEDRFIRMLGRAAADAGVEFVDVREVFAGHEPCGRTPWVNYLRFGAASGSFHPTTIGQAAYAWIVVCHLAGTDDLPACVDEGLGPKAG